MMLHVRITSALRAAIGAFLFASVLAPAHGCGDRAPYTADTFVMGTRAWVTLYGLDDAEAERAAGEALRELHRIESVMSTWRETSEISLLNASADGTPRPVSIELFSLVDSALYYSRLTGGAFDITVRPLVRLWGFQGGSPRLPADAEIDETLKRVGFGRVALDPDVPAVALPAGMELDLAGIAKGYAVDRCAALLRERGVRRALVNLGGNMYALGAPPGKNGWTIGIRDPLGSTGTVGELILKDEAVATSGNYENFVELDGVRYGHIIHPLSGRPVDHVLSVTVVAPTALASDAFSTALFVMGAEQGSALIERLAGARATAAEPADAPVGERAEIARPVERPGRVRAIFAEPADGRIVYRTAGNFRTTLELDEKKIPGD